MTDQDQSASTGNAENTNQNQAIESEPTYTKQDIDRLAMELNKYKSQAEQLNAKFKNQEIEAAKAANDWQKVAQAKEQEASEALEKLNKFKNAVVSDKRLSAVREAAIAAGIRKEAIADLSYLDYPEVRLQTDEEGNFKVEGADKAVQRLKTTRTHWFGSNVPNVNTQTPNVTGIGGKLTLDEVKKLQAEYNKNPTKENRAKTEQAILELRKQSSNR